MKRRNWHAGGEPYCEPHLWIILPLCIFKMKHGLGYYFKQATAVRDLCCQNSNVGEGKE